MLSNHYVLGTIVGTRGTIMNKAVFAFMGRQKIKPNSLTKSYIHNYITQVMISL